MNFINYETTVKPPKQTHGLLFLRDYTKTKEQAPT